MTGGKTNLLMGFHSVSSYPLYIKDARKLVFFAGPGDRRDCHMHHVVILISTSILAFKQEIGDVENWARSIEMDMRTIATALEYVHQGQLQSASS